MDPLFHVLIFTCLAFTISEGFLIIHVPRNQCLYGTKTVTVGYCNLTNPNQQWKWTEDEKLLHLKSGQCLGISRITAPSSRSTMIDCPQAPRWTCHEKENALQVANSSLFLTKQGQKVMVKLGKKYLHSWMQLDVNKEGRPVYRNVCLEKDLQDTETPGQNYRSTSSPFTVLTSSPEIFMRGSSQIFIKNVTENDNKSVIERVRLNPKLAVTEKPWIPTSTHHYSSTTEEVRQIKQLIGTYQACNSSMCETPKNIIKGLYELKNW